MKFWILFLVAGSFLKINAECGVAVLNGGGAEIFGTVSVAVADLVAPNVSFTLEEEPVVLAARVMVPELFGQRPAYRRTQLLYGERVVVLEKKEGWLRVRALDQQVIDENGVRGCHGWVQAKQIHIEAERAVFNVIVADKLVRVFEKPSRMSGVIFQASCGTKFTGVIYDDSWYKIDFLGGHVGFIARSGLRSCEEIKELTGDQVRKNIIACAQQFIGVSYVWGGRNAHGIDCSALTQLAHLSCGIDIPRYAHGQWMSCKPVEPKNLKQGDLIFLGTIRDEKLVMIHVMFCVDSSTLLEAHGFSGSVRKISVLERLGRPLQELNNGDAVPLRRFIFCGTFLK